MKRFCTLLFIMIISISVYAQYDSLWTRVYSGISIDECNALCAAANTCYFLTGYTG